MHTCHRWASYTCDTVKPFHFSAFLRVCSPDEGGILVQSLLKMLEVFPLAAEVFGQVLHHSFVSGSGHISNIYWGVLL